MKLLICSDIHGNFQAINSLLKTKYAKMCDKILVLGDLVCMGPQPNEVIELLKDNPKVTVIMGNHDKWVSVEPPPSSVNSKRLKIKHHDYMISVTKDENLEYLKSLPYYYEIKVKDKKFYFTHYGWKNNFCEVVDHPEEIENENNINDIFKDIDADCVIFGHNHDPLDFVKDQTRYICVGSLGMSKYKYFLLLTINDDGSYNIERKRLHISSHKTIKLMYQLKYPRYAVYAEYLYENKSIYQEEKIKENDQNKKRHINFNFSRNKKNGKDNRKH
ncbi:MAG: metallophosphoesterase family protein [Clostridia bacterium]|nr:metallophosphoesterase family protein [Clostridia bacterium]